MSTVLLRPGVGINGCGGNVRNWCTAARRHLHLSGVPHPSGMCQNPPLGGAFGASMFTPSKQTEMTAHVCQVARSQARHDLIGRVLDAFQCCACRLAQNEKLSRFLRTALRCHLACKLLVRVNGVYHDVGGRWRSRRQSRPMSPRPQPAESVRHAGLLPMTSTPNAIATPRGQ